jgi:hypothetical protein
LRADQRIVERLVALAEGAELLVEPARLGVELLALAREALELVGDLLAELVDTRLVVAAQRRPELVPPRVDRGEVECVL